MSLTTQDLNYHRMLMVTAAQQQHQNNSQQQQNSNQNQIANNNQSTSSMSNIITNNKQNEQDNQNDHLWDISDHDDQNNTTTTEDNSTDHSINFNSHKNQGKCTQKAMPSEPATNDCLKSSKIKSTRAPKKCQKSTKGNFDPTFETIDRGKKQVFLYDRSDFNHFQHPISSNESNDSFLVSDEDKDQQLLLPPNINNQQISKDILDQSSTSDTKELMGPKKSSSTSLSSAVSGSSSCSIISSSPNDFHNSSMDDDSHLMPTLIENSTIPVDKPLNRRQWYHLWLPSYKSRLNQFQRQFSDKISSREKLIDDFVCAIHRELLLQGRMYVSLNYISFYSNIFGYETIINISYQDICSISKATTVKLFPNAIQIVTNSGLKYFFTSFVSRERAFGLITKLWQLARLEQPMPWPEIRKLIRESYTTNGLGIDLSDIDDADVEIDLLKKNKKKKRAKRKGMGKRNSASDILVGDLSNLDSDRADLSNGDERRTNNADVQTDDIGTCSQLNCDQNHHHHHQCSLVDIGKQYILDAKRKILKIVPSQTQVVRFLFLLALFLLLVQLVIYYRFTALNQRLLDTQSLIETLQRQKINSIMNRSNTIINHDGNNFMTKCSINSNLASNCDQQTGFCSKSGIF